MKMEAKGTLKKVIKKSEINYDYKTIKITKSRIQKGLLAIPKSFSNYLPKSNQKIKVLLDDSNNPQVKTFSSFDSSTNENRIGGLKNWFFENQVKEGDELVLQLLVKERFIYRLLKEEVFLKMTKEFQTEFDTSINDKIASEKIEQISKLTQVHKTKIIYSEFLRLSKYSNEEARKRLKTSSQFSSEKTPASIRIILENLYKGYCQVCSFSFLKRDNKPYYEIHHLAAKLGHHPKNLVLVCANCHRQFEFANVEKFPDEKGWLSKVCFNQNEFFVKQAINEIEKQEFLKTVFL
jgi:hypothetical protein